MGDGWWMTDEYIALLFLGVLGLIYRDRCGCCRVVRYWMAFVAPLGAASWIQIAQEATLLWYLGRCAERP